MTAQEQQMLEDLTTRINQTQLAQKDPEAEQFLNQKLGRNPDALYIMAQTTLVQGYALEQAQKQLADARDQIAQLQQAQQQPKHSTSFLGNLLGMNDDPKPAPPQPPPYQPVPNTPPPGSYYAQQPGYPPPPQYAPQYGAPQYAPPQGGGAFQQGGFLRSAMTTATGVAAGALAFEGIESLMHGFGGHSGGQGFGDYGGGGAPREEIINNYYGDSAGEHHGGGLGSDIEDRRGDTRQFAGSGSGSDFSQPDDDSSGGAADYGADADDSSSGSDDNYDPGGNDDSF